MFNYRYLEEASDGEGSTGGTVDNAAAVADMVKEPEGDTPEGGWNLADGVVGEGDAPEWFKASKYKSVSEQAKAYNELEGKFGSFTGSPEDFTINISDELTESGVVINNDDPIMEEAFKFAKEINMNQEGFDSMLNMYAMTKLAENNALALSKEDEIKSLGANGQERLNNISAWASANLSEDLMQGFQEMTGTAESVKALEHLIAQTRSAPVSPAEITNAPAANEEELRAMQFEKDEFGNRRINTDPVFKARYNKMRDQIWGSGEHRVIVG